MHTVTVLYAMGFILPAIATLVVLPIRTRRAVTRMRANTDELDVWRRNTLREKHRAIWGEKGAADDKRGTKAGFWQEAQTEVNAAYRQKARKIRVPMFLGISFEGNDSQTIADTIHHVGKANVPTALLALAGALAATVASVWSLYLP